MNPSVKKLSVLIGIAFVDMIGFAMIFPLLPFYALRLEASPATIGWMIASFSIAQMASSPLWGRVSDRFGRRPALMVGLLGSSIGFLVFGFATSIWMLFLSRIIQGAGGGTTGVAQAYIGDAVEPRERAKALGWLSAATSAGVMIGPALGSLAANLGPEAPGILAAALCAINLGFAWRWLPETNVRKPRTSTDGPEPIMRSVRTVMAEVVLKPANDISKLIWIYATGMLGFMSMTAVFALFLGAEFGITERTIGYFFVYNGLVGVVMRAVLLGPLVDRFGEVRLMRAGALIMTLGLLLLPLTQSVWMVAAVMGLVPVGTALLFPATSALVTHRAPAHERGQVLGVQQTFGGVARVFAPIWATYVFQIGTRLPFLVAAGVVAGVGILTLRVRSTESG
ncbi:MAG: MFS transporter [Gemmatimonadales bacterium]